MAGRQFQASGEDNIRMLLTVIKLSCLGMYMFLEMFTIVSTNTDLMLCHVISEDYSFTDVIQTDAMKVTNTTWGPTVLLESLKFWFYALAASILLSLYEMWILPTAPSETDKSVNGKATTGEKNSSTTSAVEKTNAKASTGAPKLATKSMLCKKLIMDCCDILIPGSAVGWINIDPVTVGSTGCVSTLLAMGDVWSRVNPTVVKAA